MAGHYKFLVFLVTVGLGTFAMGASLVTEHFNNNSDAYWTGLNNRTGGQNYGFSNTDNTGTATNPGSPSNVGGPASGAGEFGGVVATAPFGANGGTNFYAFNVGGLNLGTTNVEAHGVYRCDSPGGNQALLVGFFKDATTFWEADPTHHNDDPKGFVGMQWGQGNNPRAQIYDIGDNGNSDPGPSLGAITTATSVPFSFLYSAPPAGSSNKGALSITVNGLTSSCNMTGTAFTGADLFNFFGVMSGGRNSNSGSATIYMDDLSFTSNNPIPVPEPASLGLLSLGGLALIRRRRQAA